MDVTTSRHHPFRRCPSPLAGRVLGLLGMAACLPATQAALPATPYAHYTGEAGIVIDGTGAMTAWEDQSGNGRDLLNRFGSPGTLTLPRDGGGTVEVAAFDGASSIWTSEGDFGSLEGDRSVVVLARVGESGSGFLFDGSTSAGKTRAQVEAGEWQVGVQGAGASFGANDPVTVVTSVGRWQVHAFLYDETGGSTVVSHHIDGIEVGRHTVEVDGALGGLILADNGGAFDKLDCEIAEVVVYDHLLDSAQVAAAVDHLHDTWGAAIPLMPAPGTLHAHYASDTGLQVDGGGLITRWDDLTGHDRHLDRVLGTPGAVTLARDGGSAAVAAFDGSSALWIRDDEFGRVENSRSVVVRARVRDTGDGFLFDGSAGDGKTRAQVRSDDWQAGVQPTSASFDTADPVTAPRTPHPWRTHAFLYEETGGATEVRHFIDGVQVGSHTVAVDTALAGLILADHGGTGAGLDCQIAEVLVYDGLLDAAQVTRATTYLESHWSGLTDALPAPGDVHARYAADDGLLLDGNGTVTRWEDRSGNGHDLDNVIGTPGHTPLARSGGGTTQVASFDGNSSIWIRSADFGSLADDRSVVVRARTMDDGDGFLFDGSTSAGMTRAQVRAGEWQVGVQGGSPFTAADPVTVPTAAPRLWQTHAFLYDEAGGSTIVSHYIDGTLAGTHSIAEDTALAGLILADNGGTSGKLNAEIAEIIVYDGLLSTSEIDQAGDYLAGRWGDVVDTPFEFVSATAVQTPRDVSLYGIHGVVALRIESTGNLPSYSVDELSFNLNGTTDLTDLAGVRLYSSGEADHFDPSQATLIESLAVPPGGSWTFTQDHQLQHPGEYLWVAVEMSGSAELGNLLDAEVTGLRLTGDPAGERVPDVTAPAGALTVNSLFYSTVLRQSGDDGSGSYRIPALEVSNDGTLLAVFDVRWDGNSISSPDLPANIDVGIMRSTDGGFTWGPMQIIMDYDENVPNSLGNGVGDPSVLVDRETGRIWCAALWSKGNRAWNGSGPGLTPDETGQFVLNYSDDDGLTWSDPVSITPQVKDPAWNLCFNGPGKGICTRDGTLVFPAQYRDAAGTAFSFFIYSTDHGATWENSPPAHVNGTQWTSEAQVVELDDGNLLLTMRNYLARKERLWNIYGWDHATETIADGSWGTAWYNETDPTVMASVERYRSVRDGHPFSALLFANPDSTSREKMTVRVSLDEGQTWPYRRKIDDRLAAYSCMTVLPDGHIGIFYETGVLSSISRMEFARFPLEWIVGDTDTDGDGIPDFHEEALGLDPGAAGDAGIDADGDGRSNLDEFQASTDPWDRESVLAVRDFDDAGGALRLRWRSVPYVAYRVESSDTLEAASWTPVAGLERVIATDLESEVELPAPNVARRFYRVTVR